MNQRHTKSGFLYVSVLVTSLIVVATATTAFSISSYRMRSQQSETDALGALRAAEAESHRIASRLSTADLSWRTAVLSGVVSAWRAGDDGAMLASRLTDEDANLADDASDLVELTCFATVGSARRGVSCTLKPVPKPLPILDYALVSSGTINLPATAAFACTGKVHCGSSVTLVSGAIASARQWNVAGGIDVAARGEKIVSATALPIPSATITASYISTGTQIPANTLAVASGARQLRRAVLTSSVNPFGTPDDEGIYWLDAGGLPVMISECRLEATLVIINCSLVTLTKANYWRSPIPGGAALLTSAAIRVDQSEAVLRESTSGVNFNPAAAPLRGNADSDTSDQYHSLLEGVVYTPGLFEWTAANPSHAMLVRGKIVCGGAAISGPLSLQDAPSSQIDPPLGFRLYNSLQFARGSWRSVPVPAI